MLLVIIRRLLLIQKIIPTSAIITIVISGKVHNIGYLFHFINLAQYIGYLHL